MFFNINVLTAKLYLGNRDNLKQLRENMKMATCTRLKPNVIIKL